MYASDQQTALEDRYYNNQSFQEDYPINDPEVAHAATKIQAQFRGHKARREVEKQKRESQGPTISNDSQKSLSVDSSSLQKENKDDKSIDDEDMTEEEKRQLERAAVSIQAQFRGFQVRKTLRETPDNSNEEQDISHQRQQGYGNNRDDSSPLSSTRISGRHDLGDDPRFYDDIEAENNGNLNQPQLEREPTQLSADFERQKGYLYDPNYNQDEQQRSFNDDDDDMSDPNLDKAATRIQASYRGYKTRKELGSNVGHSPTGQDQQHLSPTSSEIHQEYDNARNKNILSPSAEGNKEPVQEEEEEEDNAAAVKIQAAYRGYRVRKDKEK